MLTKQQIEEAVVQMKTSCDLKMKGYEPVSARGLLNELGFGGDADQVLEYLFEGGFTYCLDPKFAATHFDPNNPEAVNGMVTDHAPARACYWGPDQLKSRLEWVLPFWKHP